MNDEDKDPRKEAVALAIAYAALAEANLHVAIWHLRLCLGRLIPTAVVRIASDCVKEALERCDDAGAQLKAISRLPEPKPEDSTALKIMSFAFGLLWAGAIVALWWG